MSLLGRLALLFVIVPLVELALLIQMGQIIGFWPTIASVVFTGVAGAWLARTQGLRTMWRLRHDLANGRVPGQAIMDGMAVLAGGALLLTPGVLTDLIGFGLLFPRTRHAIQKRIMARLERHIREGAVHVRVAGGEIWASSSDAVSTEAVSTDAVPSDPVSTDPMSSDAMSPSRSTGE